jgi:hypothetical protein
VWPNSAIENVSIGAANFSFFAAPDAVGYPAQNIAAIVAVIKFFLEPF